MNNAYTERRQRQRFAAQRDGKTCVSVSINGGTSLPIIDLSLDGFSIPAEAITSNREFDFEMRLIDGFGDKVRGRARAMNTVPGQTGPQAGCSILTLTDGDGQTLQEWLTVIVICGASVRLSPQDAEAIVKGPSLI